MQKSTLVEAQESAGFFEPDQRVCLGGLFNQIFFFSNIGAAQPGEPTGAVSLTISHFNFYLIHTVERLN
jgi:hypothetical protein